MPTPLGEAEFKLLSTCAEGGLGRFDARGLSTGPRLLTRLLGSLWEMIMVLEVNIPCFASLNRQSMAKT
jgi:hypothetical protein